MGVAIAPGERRGAVQVGWRRGDGDHLHRVVVGIRHAVGRSLAVVVQEVHVLDRFPVDAGRAHPIQQREVVAAALVPVLVQEVPQHHQAGAGVLRVDVGERQAVNEGGLLSAGFLDDGAAAVQGVAATVGVGGRLQVRVPVVRPDRPVDDRVDVFAVFVVPENLGRQQVFGEFPVVLAEDRPALQRRGVGRAAGRHPERQPHEPGYEYGREPSGHPAPPRRGLSRVRLLCRQCDPCRALDGEPWPEQRTNAGMKTRAPMA